MFRESINSPISPIPVEYTNTLKRLENEPDYSLTCLGIALLKKRIEEYGGIAGGFFDFDKEEDCVANFLDNAKEVDSYPLFYYYRYNTAEDEKALIEKLKEEGFCVKESIGLLLKNKAETDCLAVYHETKNIAGIFIKSKDLRFYHMLISFLSLLFPSLFKDAPLDDRDYEVIKSLSKTSKDAFIAQIKTSVAPYTEQFTKMMLVTVISAMHKGKIEAAERNVTQERRALQEAEEQFSYHVRHLKELIVLYEGIKATEGRDDGENDFVDYLCGCKQIKNLTVNGDIMSFAVATSLVNYNSDTWDLFAKRDYIYDGKYTYDGRYTINLKEQFKDKENRKLFLNSLFCEEPEFTIKMCGNFELNLSGCTARTRSAYEYKLADPVFEDYMKNPHLNFYECLGGYKDRIAKALFERNYIGAIEMCIASAGSLDLDETEQTFRPFVGYLMSSDKKVLVAKDGTETTPVEALEYLKSKENKE